MSVVTFQPWLFDNYDAWTKACADPRWKYDLPLASFMSLYAEHRAGSMAATAHSPVSAPISLAPLGSFTSKADPFLAATAKPATPPPPPAASSEASQILSQNEIDSLLGMLSG